MQPHISYMRRPSEREALTAPETYPHLYSLPQPSIVHWLRRAPPFTPSDERPYLMSYAGSRKGDVAVRRLVADYCNRSSGSKTCLMPSSMKTVEVAFVKMKSVFCLEPAGDTPFRRSIADSAALGCIPVLMNNVSDLTGNLVWDDWREQSRVLLPRDELIAGRLDLGKALARLPRARVALMQHTLWLHARKLQVSYDDDQRDSVFASLSGILSARGLSRLPRAAAPPVTRGEEGTGAGSRSGSGSVAPCTDLPDVAHRESCREIMDLAAEVSARRKRGRRNAPEADPDLGKVTLTRAGARRNRMYRR